MSGATLVFLGSRRRLDERLERMEQRLEYMEQDLKHVRSRTNQIYDVLENHGLPMAKVTED